MRDARVSGMMRDPTPDVVGGVGMDEVVAAATVPAGGVAGEAWLEERIASRALGCEKERIRSTEASRRPEVVAVDFVCVPCGANESLA